LDVLYCYIVVIVIASKMKFSISLMIIYVFPSQLESYSVESVLKKLSYLLLFLVVNQDSLELYCFLFSGKFSILFQFTADKGNISIDSSLQLRDVNSIGNFYLLYSMQLLLSICICKVECVLLFSPIDVRDL
jgi:hypothetical protein